MRRTARVLDDTGDEVGHASRLFRRESGGLYVFHEEFTLQPAAQGRGFGSAWYRALEDWYRRSGVREVRRLFAAYDAGGYAWARQGFRWAEERTARGVFARLASALATDRHVTDDERRDAERLLDRARSTPFDDPDFPQAAEIAIVGRDPAGGRGQLHFGRRVMAGSKWFGRKLL